MIETVRKHFHSSVKSDLWNLTDGRCWYCGDHLNPFQNLTLDHVEPISKGGKDDPTNLVPACRACNLAKGTLFPLRSFLPKFAYMIRRRMEDPRRSQPWYAEMVDPGLGPCFWFFLYDVDGQLKRLEELDRKYGRRTA